MTTGSSPLRDASGPPVGERSASARSPVTGGNLVIFRTGGFADAVVALPCFHAIARAFPGAHRILLPGASAGPAATSMQGLLEGAGLVHETISYPSLSGQVWSLPAMVQRLRQIAPRALVCLAEQPPALSIYRDLLVFKAAGIPRILGAPWNAADGQCRTEVKTGELEYEAERLARVLGADIPVDLSPPSWDLRLTTAEREAASRRLAALPPGLLPVALTPGGRPSARDWGEAKWATLAGLLHLRLTRVGLVLMGDAETRERASRLAQLSPDRVINLCGELTPREQAAVLERCGLLVCCAGGAMHLAASVGLTCIALIGSLDRPHQWHPYGGQHVVIHAQGMREIGVERVADAVVASVDRLRVPAQSVSPLQLAHRAGAASGR